MSKVIRTARVSGSPVRIGIAAEHGASPLPPIQVDDEGFVHLANRIARRVDHNLIDDPGADILEALAKGGFGEDAETFDDEGLDSDEDSGDEDAETRDADDSTEGEDPEATVSKDGAVGPEPEPEEPVGYSAVQLEEIVEERLKGFEGRFQKEKEAAYRSGFEDGHTEGLKHGQEQSRLEIERFRAIINSIGSQWPDIIKSTDADLVELAIAVASRIIGASVESSREPVFAAIRESLSYLEDKSRVVLRVHPVDLDTVRRHRHDWLESLEGLGQLFIEGDEEISPGGCVIETPKGDVDAQIEERLDRLRATLVEAIRQQNGDLASDRELDLDPEIPPEVLADISRAEEASRTAGVPEGQPSDPAADVAPAESMDAEPMGDEPDVEDDTSGEPTVADDTPDLPTVEDDEPGAPDEPAADGQQLEDEDL